MIRQFRDISLLDRNSFAIETTARELIEFSEASDLLQIFADQSVKQRWMVVSGGNNILFTTPYDGVIITPKGDSITVQSEDDNEAIVSVEAGVEWDDLVAWSVDRGLWGGENLSLIPGKAGAAPIQNIGAYGVELKDVLVSVDYFDVEEMGFKSLRREECELGYRDSIFKRELRGRVVITAITVCLSKIPKPRLEYADLCRRVESRGEPLLRTIRDVVCEVRDGKLPDPKVLGNAGSFFKNPVVSYAKLNELQTQYPDIPSYPTGDPAMAKLAAGWLIDRAGLKGLRDGNVGVHVNQALVLVNYGGASGAEVAQFAQMVQSRVELHFGVRIESEVNFV